MRENVLGRFSEGEKRPKDGGEKLFIRRKRPLLDEKSPYTKGKGPQTEKKYSDGESPQMEDKSDQVDQKVVRRQKNFEMKNPDR